MLKVVRPVAVLARSSRSALKLDVAARGKALLVNVAAGL
jgi:hypothetical protein